MFPILRRRHSDVSTSQLRYTSPFKSGRHFQQDRWGVHAVLYYTLGPTHPSCTSVRQWCTLAFSIPDALISIANSFRLMIRTSGYGPRSSLFKIRHFSLHNSNTLRLSSSGAVSSKTAGASMLHSRPDMLTLHVCTTAVHSRILDPGCSNLYTTAILPGY